MAWMFDKKGLIQVDKKSISEDELMELALDAGAEDVLEEENEFHVYTTPESFDDVQNALEKAGVKTLEASVSRIPQNTIEVTEEKPARALLKLLESLEDHDDVQSVHANFDIDDELMEKLQ